MESPPERLSRGAHTWTHAGGLEVHEVELRVPPDLLSLRGHFEGDPILPAVTQLFEAVVLVGEIWPRLARLRRVTQAKFRSPIRPGDCLRIRLQLKASGAVAGFEYLRNGETCSSGVLEFAISTKST